MEIFEIHITGDESIIQASARLGVRSIVIDLLHPDQTHYRTEYMTSNIRKLELDINTAVVPENFFSFNANNFISLKITIFDVIQS